MKEFEGPKRIVNISSGAGRRAYEGWGVYCTTKAGLDHFSRVIALEQENVEHQVDIVSIAPGIIDTGMQETIRTSKEEAFPLLDQFIDYKENGLLSSADQTAEKLISFLWRMKILRWSVQSRISVICSGKVKTTKHTISQRPFRLAGVDTNDIST